MEVDRHIFSPLRIGSSTPPVRRGRVELRPGEWARVTLVGALDARRRVVVSPPLGEEQEYARTPLHRVARCLADAGHLVVTYDPIGHGDSDGDDLGTLDRLVDDLRAVSAATATPGVPLDVVAVRAGALVAAKALAERAFAARRLLLVSPVLRGAPYVNDLLRRLVATEVAQRGLATRSVAKLAAHLQAGGTVDCDGHRLGGRLFEELSGADAGPWLASLDATDVEVLLVRTPTSAWVAPAGAADAAALGRSRDVRVREVEGLEFWREHPRFVGAEAPDLATAITEALDG